MLSGKHGGGALKVLERTIAIVGWPFAGLAIAHGIWGYAPAAYAAFGIMGLIVGLTIPSMLQKDG